MLIRARALNRDNTVYQHMKTMSFPYCLCILVRDAAREEGIAWSGIYGKEVAFGKNSVIYKQVKGV